MQDRWSGLPVPFNPDDIGQACCPFMLRDVVMIAALAHRHCDKNYRLKKMSPRTGLAAFATVSLGILNHGVGQLEFCSSSPIYCGLTALFSEGKSEKICINAGGGTTADVLRRLGWSECHGPERGRHQHRQLRKFLPVLRNAPVPHSQQQAKGISLLLPGTVWPDRGRHRRLRN